VACARTNVAALGGLAFVGDLYAALPVRLRGRIDVLLANVPYVPTDDIALMPPEAREHEPRVALDGGPDGLDVARRVIAGAPDWLAPGGSLLFEISEEQAPSAVGIVAGSGLSPRVVTDDDVGATVVVGSRG
jgi:release factor glutamine methyltransferase